MMMQEALQTLTILKRRRKTGTGRALTAKGVVVMIIAAVIAFLAAVVLPKITGMQKEKAQKAAVIIFFIGCAVAAFV